MEQIRLPSPTLSFETSGISSSPLSDRKVLCTGRCGDAFIFDAGTRHVVTMPTINRPKWKPISIFVPSAGGRDADPDPDPDGSLFVMERRPKQEGKSSGWQSDQFEAFVYRRSSKTSPSKSWHHELLPLPPFLRDHDSKYRRFQYEISSYGVVGDGSHIFISAEGHKAHKHYNSCSSVAVTYCLDTVKHTWSEVGEWKLPFRGKVEYVPELKLWFGIPDKYKDLGAADLSTMDSEPSLVRAWILELDDTLNKDLEFDETPNKEWQELQEYQLVHLGSGRFCIASSFHTMRIIRTCLGNELTFKRFAVFTGVEVMPPAHGLGEIQMVEHKSKLTPDVTSIDIVF